MWPFNRSRKSKPATQPALTSDQASARESFFRSLGTPDDDVWMPLLNPMFAGGPTWPGRPGWRRVIAGTRTIIVSDGLSESFDSDKLNYGFGVEILTETSDLVPDDIRGSWLFHIAHEISHNAARHGQFRDLIEAHEVGTVEIHMDHDIVAPMRTARGTVGVFLGQHLPDERTHFPTPGGDVLIITAKLLTLSELEYALKHGPDGYKALRQRFIDTGSHHVSSIARHAVV